MSAKLFKFLIQLTEDFSTQANYRRDPKGTLQAAGISPSEQEAVLSNDPEKVRRALASDLASLDRAASLIGNQKISLTVNLLHNYH